MINNVYGKTMNNLRKRISVRLVNNEKDFLKYNSRPTHITHKIFDTNHAAIHKIKPVLTLNKSIYMGFTILELSKWPYTALVSVRNGRIFSCRVIPCKIEL